MTNQDRRICNTCKHDPSGTDKWPCMDCDTREPADRWEPKEAKHLTESSLIQNGLDTISRQAAIDALGKASDELYENIKKGATFPQRQWFDGMAQAQSILENLPSAQPDQSIKEKSVDIGYLHDWYQNSVTDDPPVWTDEHIKEMFCDFYMIPRQGKEREEIMNEFDRTPGGD